MLRRWSAIHAAVLDLIAHSVLKGAGLLLASELPDLFRRQAPALGDLRSLCFEPGPHRGDLLPDRRRLLAETGCKLIDGRLARGAIGNEL